MDILAHGLYGITVCSQKGLAGGRTGSPAAWYRERTVWWALGFGIAPDVLSMWVPFIVHQVAGTEGNFFHHFGGSWLVVYRAVHSLTAAALLSIVLWKWRPALVVPSLAWPLHVVLDAVSHGNGKYKTMFFYPFSEWGINGIGWWHTPWLFLGYWIVLLTIWAGLYVWRRLPREGRPAARPDKN